MPRENVEDRLLDLAAKRFKKDRATLRVEDDMFAKLGIDSFQAMELLTDVEDEFEVEIPDYELKGVTTFVALAGVIGKRL